MSRKKRLAVLWWVMGYLGAAAMAIGVLLLIPGNGAPCGPLVGIALLLGGFVLMAIGLRLVKI